MDATELNASLVAVMLTGDDQSAPLLLDLALLSDNVPLLESVVRRWGPRVLNNAQADPLGRPPMLAAAFHGAI